VSQMKDFFETLPGYVWRTLPGGGLDLASPGMLSYVGPLTEELIRDWRALVHPDDRSHIDTAKIASHVPPSETSYPPLRLRRYDGSYRWFQCSSLSFLDDNAATGALCAIGADIHEAVLATSDLRHRESAMRAIIDCIPGFVWQLGPGGELQYLNSKVFEYTGKTLEELREPGWRDSLHPDDVEAFIEQWKFAMQTNASIMVEYRLRRSDGVYRWFRTIGEPIRDRKGQAVGWCGVDIDIDEEKRTAQKLRSAQSQLVRTAQLAIAAELTASTADAISQPLAAIVANAFACQRWLSSSPPDLQRARPIMGLIVQDSKAAAAIVQRILAIIRRTPAAQLPVNVNAEINEALRLLDDELKEVGVAVRTVLSPNVAPVQANAALLQQVLVNLIRNSIDALRGHGPESRMIIIETQARSDELTVEIADNGVGFPDGSPLFEAFFTTKADALGLGLAIARSIVESYAGRVWALRNDPSGAIFGFSLPASKI
jgi:PAS domain S-box-containing protein